jgi:thiamine pyrophosphate-dependent acetolactate synthase large subunit-like protein
MLTRDQFLLPLAALRTDEAIVTTMSVVRPWGRLTRRPELDLASADSAMGHAADLALGIALAQPQRKVISLNGDGSMLMTLGTLATIVGSGAENLVLIVVNNGTYEITGNQPLAGAGTLDFAGLAGAAGFPKALSFRDPEAWADAVPSLLRERGPIFVDVTVEPGSEGPIFRTPSEESEYLRVSLFDSARVLQNALHG